MKKRVFIKSRKEEVEIQDWKYHGMMQCRLWIYDKETNELKDELFLKEDLIFIVDDEL